MQRFEGQVQVLRREAARCERLCAGSHDPALSSQLLALAREFRTRASAIAARGTPA